MIKKLVVLAAVVASVAACSDGNTVANVVPAFTVALTGDMPYGANAADTQELNAYSAYVAAVNADKDVSMVLHSGDIHSGKQYCTLDYNIQVFQNMAGFDMPLIYTPGDNEWADCHKGKKPKADMTGQNLLTYFKEGGGYWDGTQIVYHTDAADHVSPGNYLSYAKGDPLANLKMVRDLFFAYPGKTLGQTMTVHTQAQEFDAAHPTDKDFVENVWFEKSGVLFATVNIPGGSNNGNFVWYGAPSMSREQTDEIANRTGATLRWLDTVFAKAKANGDHAMVIMVQGDMWDLDGNSMSANTLNQLKQYIDKLAAKSLDFGKPVLLVNGDSHFYRSDNPLVKGADCKIEVPSILSGAKSTATETCAASATAGALHADGIIVDANPAIFADAYMTVQDPTQPATVAGTVGTDPVVNPYTPTYNVPNFHRLVVHGNATPSGTDLEYIKLTIDPNVSGTAVTEANGTGSFGPFSWKRIQPMR